MASSVLQFKRGNAGIAGTVPALKPGEPAFTINNFDFYVGLDTSVAGNKFFGSHRYWGREDGSTSLRLKLVDKTGSGGEIQLKSPDSHTGITTYTFPSTPVADNFLKVAADGTLSWDTFSISSSFNNATLAGVTTISGDLNNDANTDNSGITTFSNSTDNSLGNLDSGAVQISGGVAIAKNVTIGAGLSVSGSSHFIGTSTFYGGRINLGDNSTDEIVVEAQFKSSLIPSDDSLYNLGSGSKRWNNASFSGIGTFATGAVIDGVQIGINGSNVIDTVSGDLRLNSAGGTTIIDDAVIIQNNLAVNGNVTVGGTTITLKSEDVFIENKDIILGFTTAITPNDDTANHAGVAIASTIGSPLVSFSVSGINTLPDTYKQLMWFKNGTLGFATDAFAFNYGVAIGTTIMANGVRLAVGSGITMSDDGITANSLTITNLNTSSATANLFNANATYINAFQSATDIVIGSESGITTFRNSVRVTDSLYDSSNNPGTTGQFLMMTGAGIGWTTIAGVAAGTISTATRATAVDTIETNNNAIYYVTFADTATGQEGETLRVGAALSLNASSGDVYFKGKVVSNDFRSSTNSNNTLTFSDLDAAFARNLSVSGIATISQDLTVGGNLYINGSTTQVNTTTLTVEDTLIELGLVDGATPSSDLNKDLGLLLNYYSGSAKKAAVFWDDSVGRIVFADDVTESSGVLTVASNAYAAVEIESLWVNDCAGSSQVINCSGTTRTLENITIDCGEF